MTTNAIPEEGDVAEKKVCSASTPPAEAPMPTTGKLSAALNEWSTGAATSSAPPEGVAAEPSPRSSVGDVIWSWPLPAVVAALARCELCSDQVRRAITALSQSVTLNRQRGAFPALKQ